MHQMRKARQRGVNVGFIASHQGQVARPRQAQLQALASRNTPCHCITRRYDGPNAEAHERRRQAENHRACSLSGGL